MFSNSGEVFSMRSNRRSNNFSKDWVNSAVSGERVRLFLCFWENCQASATKLSKASLVFPSISRLSGAVAKEAMVNPPAAGGLALDGTGISRSESREFETEIPGVGISDVEAWDDSALATV